MSTANSATLPVEGGSEIEPSQVTELPEVAPAIWSLPGLLKSCLMLSQLKKSPSLSICFLGSLMARAWSSLRLVAPCTSVLLPHQPSKERAGFIPSAIIPSSAVLQPDCWGKETESHCHYKHTVRINTYGFSPFILQNLGNINDQVLLAAVIDYLISIRIPPFPPNHWH